jgi:hypothetical protein
VLSQFQHRFAYALQKCGPWVIALALAGCTAEEPAGNAGPSSGTAGSAGASSTGGTTQVAPGDAGDIGYAPVGRLNRAQYDNTVRDLLGTTQQPATHFPSDELVLGFDAIASVQRVQPEHVEKYLAASDSLVTELIARAPTDPLRLRYVSCDLNAGASCVAEVVENLATAAWRRPVNDAELAPYVSAAQAQSDAAAGISVALRAVLTSAKFLFRWELDPNPEDATPHLLNDYEMATRLSYALRSTTPDAELTSAAADGRLSTAEGVLLQARRLLDTGPGLVPFVNSFGAQWLNVNQVAAVTPNPEAYPTFDAELRASMIEETKQFLRELMATNVPVARLFDADFAYVNARLAQHYGISPAPAQGWQRVATTGTSRGGLLTLGSYLAATSNPTRTSPVKRGYFVLDRLLCSAPPPPPADVSLNIDEGSGLENLPVRQRVAKHEEKGSSCFACHRIMDAIGLGLENYDAIGTYRAADSFGPIDATGTLPSGDAEVAFDGVRELSALLAQDARILPCVVKKLMTFSLGRELSSAQAPHEQAVTDRTLGDGGSLRAAIEAVVTSDVFRMRRAQAASEVSP